MQSTQRNGTSLMVVMPVRARQTLDVKSRLSLDSINQHLSHFPRVILYPQKFPPGDKFDGWEMVGFPDRFFGSPNNYSKFLLHPAFYEIASGFEWLLVVHLDVLILQPIEPWLSENFDYIGAPWFHPDHTGRMNSLHAGNGGLSLRRTRKFIHVLNSKLPASLGAKRDGTKRDFRLRLFCFVASVIGIRVRAVAGLLPHFKIHEDTFWARGAPLVHKNFLTAPPRVAVRFAWETHPRECWELGCQVLPFGIHAWDQYDLPFIISVLPEDLKTRIKKAGLSA